MVHPMSQTPHGQFEPSAGSPARHWENCVLDPSTWIIACGGGDSVVSGFLTDVCLVHRLGVLHGTPKNDIGFFSIKQKVDCLCTLRRAMSESSRARLAALRLELRQNRSISKLRSGCITLTRFYLSFAIVKCFRTWPHGDSEAYVNLHQCLGSSNRPSVGRYECCPSVRQCGRHLRTNALLCFESHVRVAFYARQNINSPLWMDELHFPTVKKLLKDSIPL